MAVLQIGLDLFGLSLPLLLLLAGTGLVIAEAIAPGAHFIVLGVALLVAGLVGTLALPILGVAGTIFLMTVAVLVAGAGSLWGYRRLGFRDMTGRGATSDSDSLRGKVGRVTEVVTPSSGEVKLESGGFTPYYQARTLDGTIDVGEEVMVIDPGGGNVVTVESLSAPRDAIDRELERGRRHDADGEPEAGTETETA